MYRKHKLHFIIVRYQGKGYKSKVMVPNRLKYMLFGESREHLEDRILSYLKNFRVAFRLDNNIVINTDDIEQIYIDDYPDIQMTVSYKNGD